MANYDVHVVCDQCSQPHFVNVKISLADEGLDRSYLSDHFAGQNLPPEIAFMQTNKYRCPHTMRLFSAEDITRAVFFKNG
ncbi:MAG: hypothetical protein ABIV48_04640 [Pyrinomonadaceae bacterium]